MFYKRRYSRVLIVAMCIVAMCIGGKATKTEAADYEYAWFPAPTMNITQIAYESYSHSNNNAIDFVSGGNVFAPFTGKIVYKDANWGYVLLQSTNEVYYADGTLDYMTVAFMHDSNISDLSVGQVIKQGKAFYQAGGMGSGNPNAYPVHVDLSIFRGKVNSVSRYGRGDTYAYNAFYINSAKTTSIVNKGKVESGNRVTNGYSNWSSLWKDLSSAKPIIVTKPTITSDKTTYLRGSNVVLQRNIVTNVQDYWLTVWCEDEQILSAKMPNTTYELKNLKPGKYRVSLKAGDENGSAGSVEYKFSVAKECAEHAYDKGVIVRKATCSKEGLKKYTCKVCGKTKEVSEKINHNYEEVYTVDKQATSTQDGSKSKHCADCDAKNSVVTIYQASNVRLEKEAYIYNGKTQEPNVIVEDSKGETISSSNYTLKYSSSSIQSVGQYSVQITFKGDYSGSEILNFTIVPKNPTSVKAVLYGCDDVKVSWSKVSGATGYKVSYKKSTDSSWSSKSTTDTSVKLADLSDGAKYKIKVVSYKTVSEDEYYSTGKSTSIYTLQKVENVKVVTSGTNVKVSWSNIAGESGYEISQSTRKNKTEIVSTYNTTSGEFKTISARKGKTYYYKVRAYKAVDGKKIYGAWSKVVTYEADYQDTGRRVNSDLTANKGTSQKGYILVGIGVSLLVLILLGVFIVKKYFNKKK